MSDGSGMRDVYEMLTYLLIIIFGCIIMAVWLKRKAKRKQK